MKLHRPFAATSLALLASAVLAFSQDDRPSPDRQNPNPLGSVSLSDVQSFTERPLFVPTRRPAERMEAALPAAEPPTQSNPAFVLLGVTTGPDGAVARVATKEGTTIHSLRLGEKIDDWELRSIEPLSVTLSRNGDVIVLAVFRANSDETEGDTTSESPPAGIVFSSE